MNLTEPFVLVPDLDLIPASELAQHRREELGCEPGDVVLTRRSSRTPSRIITSDLGALLRQFRVPKSFVSALIDYCDEEGLEAAGLLEQTLAALLPLISAGWLIQDGDSDLPASGFSYDVGATFAGFTVIDQVQAVEDTEVYQAVDPGGTVLALKVAKLPCDVDTKAQFQNEISTLQAEPGWPTPRLMASGAALERPFLATEWIRGSPITVIARDLRAMGDRSGLVRLARSAAAAYAQLHGAGIVHGDVYPRNILVDDEGKVWLVDFGHGHRHGAPFAKGWLRKGSPEFYDPQFAASIKNRTPAPDPSTASDQYALAAVLYSLFTGAHYVDLSPQAAEMLDQIIQEPAVAFRRRGVQAWPAVEETLNRALAKDPDDRFPQMIDLVHRLDRLRPERREVSQDSSRRERREAQKFVDDLSPAVLDASDRFPVASVAHGAAGVAAAFLELAVSRDNARDLESADLWSMQALRTSHVPGGFESRELELTAERIGSCSVHYGAPGVDLVRARVAQAMGDSRGLAEAVDALAPLATQPGATELAMGKAGLLLGAALILDDRLDEGAGDETARRAIGSVRAFGEQSLQELVRADGSRKHLGMAHGLGGELHASLVWSEVSAAPPAPGIVDRLELLASLARSHGRGLRWPTQPPPAPTAYFESWCHGTPGHVLLWTAAARIVNDDYLNLAERAAMTVADTEAVNATLCCGAAGRAYAFLAMYRSTGERAWLTRARTQAARAWKIRDALPSPRSLLQGALGPAVLLLTIDDPDRCTFPLLERWR